MQPHTKSTPVLSRSDGRFLRTVVPPAKGRLELRDRKVPGLVLRMTASGSASWSVRVLARDGKHTRPSLGTWPHVGISEARKLAMAAIAAIQAGGDPIAEKQAAARGAEGEGRGEDRCRPPRGVA